MSKFCAWFKFYPRDWLDDTRELTPEQRGAYIDIICEQMLADGPIPDNYRWLSFKLHISERKAKALVESLIDELKLRRGSQGLYNQRAQEEIENRAAKSRANARSALARWRPDVDPTVIDHRVNDDPTVSFEREPSEPPENIQQKQQSEPCDRNANAMPRARAQDTDTDTDTESPYSPPAGGHDPAEGEVKAASHPPSAEMNGKSHPRGEGGQRVFSSEADPAPNLNRGSHPSIDSAFEEFWKGFPEGRKKGTGKTRDLFQQIVTGKHRTRRATADQLIQAARRYRDTKPDPKYVPLPTTWLNEGRWEDEVAAPAKTFDPSKVRR